MGGRSGESLRYLTGMFTVVYRGERGTCWDGTVTSQLKPLFPPHEKRPRSWAFKPTPEGSTVLVNARQTAQVLPLSFLFSFLFFFNPIWILPNFQILSSGVEA